VTTSADGRRVAPVRQDVVGQVKAVVQTLLLEDSKLTLSVRIHCNLNVTRHDSRVFMAVFAKSWTNNSSLY